MTFPPFPYDEPAVNNGKPPKSRQNRTMAAAAPNIVHWNNFYFLSDSGNLLTPISTHAQRRTTSPASAAAPGRHHQRPACVARRLPLLPKPSSSAPVPVLVAPSWRGILPRAIAGKSQFVIGPKSPFETLRFTPRSASPCCRVNPPLSYAGQHDALILHAVSRTSST